MKKILSMWAILTLTGGMMLTTEAQAPEQPIEIVETVEIEPNIKTLLENEVHYTKHWDENTYDDTIQLSIEDAQLLMKIASAEALNQGKNGMLKVMTVVINRRKDPEYPDTIWGVFSQENQFSSYLSGAWKKAEITPECHEALAELEKNRNLDTSIYAFETVSNGNTLTAWFDMAYSYRDHIFYTKK